MLFSERKRDQETAGREAAGENLWVEHIHEHVRVRLVEIAGVFAEALRQRDTQLGRAVARILRARLGHIVSEQIQSALSEDGSVPVLNWLGAAHIVITEKLGEKQAGQFASLVNHVFRQEGTAARTGDSFG